MTRRVLLSNQGSVSPWTRANGSNLQIVVDGEMAGKRDLIGKVRNANHSLESASGFGVGDGGRDLRQRLGG